MENLSLMRFDESNVSCFVSSVLMVENILKMLLNDDMTIPLVKSHFHTFIDHSSTLQS